jgi:hypothetical protein
MSEFLLPTGPQAETTQQLLGFTPDHLGAMLRDGTFEVISHNRLTHNSILRPHHMPGDREVVIRYLPWNDACLGEAMTHWHQKELAKLQGKGINIPMHYPVIGTTALGPEHLQGGKSQALYAVVEHVAGDNLQQNLQGNKITQRPLITLGRMLLDYYTDDHPAGEPAIFDIAYPRQHVQTPSEALYLLDLDPFPAADTHKEIVALFSWVDNFLRSTHASRTLQRATRHALGQDRSECKKRLLDVIEALKAEQPNRGS